jgi:hypothetical protein
MGEEIGPDYFALHFAKGIKEVQRDVPVHV